MKLLIDNLDGRGAQDYTGFVDSSKRPSLARRLNRPSELKLTLAGEERVLPVASLGARVTLTLSDGSNLFTGYMVEAPTYRYAGWGESGAAYRHEIVALSDVMLMDRKAPPPHPPFVARSAGDALRQLTAEALPGWFDLSGVQASDLIPYYSVNPAKRWTESAAEIALAGGCAYGDGDGKIWFTPLGANTYALAETDGTFSPSDLQLRSVDRVVNDLTVLGQLEPSAYVKDYFVGDGYTTRFYLSQKPFTRSNEIPIYSRTILDEDYATLDSTHWAVTDPQDVITVSSGQLQVSGGTGTDGQTLLSFIEKVELGGATVLEHGDVAFTAASNGVIGGLYSGAVSIAGCLAGFRITPSGSNSNIQALIGGVATGPALATQAGHHYVFTTQLYPTEVYRMQQVFHSAVHPSGTPRGGGAIACDVRAVLEVQDIDPGNPGSQIAAATVLYDGVLTNAPGYCTYALVNAGAMHCSVAFTYLRLATDALVRSTLPGQTTRTRQTGSLRDGAECHVSNEPALQFYPEYIPAANETVEVTYRGQGHAMARVINSPSMAALRSGGDDGVRGSVREVGMPVPRTSAECEAAALALLDESGQGWIGEYRASRQSLPGGAEDIFPGDRLQISIPSRRALFAAIVREVDVEIADLAGEENNRYTLRFVDAGDPSLVFALATARVPQAEAPSPVDVEQVGTMYLANLTSAEVTSVTSTTVTIDVGFVPVAGGGIEVRYTDMGWGAANNRNLAGRYTSRSFTLPRYARAQTYFLRSYDGSVPPKYSRYSTALHVDWPL